MLLRALPVRQEVTGGRKVVCEATAIYAVEIAERDAYCWEQEIPIALLFGGEPGPVETDLTIGIMSVKAATGFDHLKVKPRTDLTKDVEQVVAAGDGALDASVKIVANQGWTPYATIRFADRVADAGVRLELVE